MLLNMQVQYCAFTCTVIKGTFPQRKQQFPFKELETMSNTQIIWCLYKECCGVTTVVSWSDLPVRLVTLFAFLCSLFPLQGISFSFLEVFVCHYVTCGVTWGVAQEGGEVIYWLEGCWFDPWVYMPNILGQETNPKLLWVVWESSKVLYKNESVYH